MKKFDKKGFTIVELVIVIAVIAILAGVMIPTFSNLVEKANDSARMQLASSAYREAYALALADDGAITAGGETVEVHGIEFVIMPDGSATTTLKTGVDAKLTGCTITVAAGGAVTVTSGS